MAGAYHEAGRKWGLVVRLTSLQVLGMTIGSWVWLLFGLVVAVAFVVGAVNVARVVNPVAGAWVATGGWRRRVTVAVAVDERGRPPTSRAPMSQPAPSPLPGPLFATYLPGYGTSSDLVSALAQTTGAVTVEHAAAVCRALRVRAELRSIDGVVRAMVETDGACKVVGG